MWYNNKSRPRKKNHNSGLQFHEFEILLTLENENKVDSYRNNNTPLLNKSNFRWFKFISKPISFKSWLY